MYKYLNKDDIKRLILSLSLIDNDFKDEHKLKILYTLSNNIENSYREFKIKKKNGEYRLLREPKPLLKMVQRNILNNYLYEQKPSKYVTSYIKGKTIKDNAIKHINKKTILKLDIKSFFDNIDFLTVYSTVFGLDEMPKQIGILLTSLCCYYDTLPQGAPTSAYISNLVLKDFDETLGTWCEKKNIEYSRYSDDMTFSGDFEHSEVIRHVNTLLKNIT